jgi:hypothetical protein
LTEIVAFINKSICHCQYFKMDVIHAKNAQDRASNTNSPACGQDSAEGGRSDALVLTEPINSPQAAYRTSVLPGSQMGISGMKSLSVTPVAGFCKTKARMGVTFS